MSTSAASLIACLATLAFITDLPSSLTATAPFSLSFSKSVIYSPSCPAVIAAIGSTLISVTSFALSIIYLTISTLSIAGLVLGMAQTVVNPPLAAALAPVRIVSLCSKPGSLKWTCKSISPGITNIPSASITFSASSVIFSATLRITPSSKRTSFTASVLLAGSNTLPPLINVFIILSFPTQQSIVSYLLSFSTFPRYSNSNWFAGTGLPK